MIAYGNFLFRHRNWVFPVVMFALFVGFRPAPWGGSPDSDRLLDLLGIAIVIAGLALRGAVVGLAYIKRGGLHKKVYADDLVTSGMFAHCRNPLYVGNLLMLTGFLVIHNNPWVYGLGGLFFLTAYRAIVAAEEDFLSRKFGVAFAAYCQDVPRWAIRVRGLGRTFRDMEFQWKRVLVKDYSTMDTGLITVLALLALQTISLGGLAVAGETLLRFGALLIAVQLPVLTILIMKKTGRLKLVGGN